MKVSFGFIIKMLLFKSFFISSVRRRAYRKTGTPRPQMRLGDLYKASEESSRTLVTSVSDCMWSKSKKAPKGQSPLDAVQHG